MSTTDELWQFLGFVLAESPVVEGLVPSAAERAFGRWLAAVTPSLRRSLRSFAEKIDTEAVVQEASLRMWIIAKAIAQQEREPLGGANASLRFALRIARNLALNMIRKGKHEDSVDPSDPSVTDFVSPEPVEPDPLLHDLIQQCIKLLTANPLKAIVIRVEHGHRPEAEQALLAGMTKNTFHQNIRRARLQLIECLTDKGIELGVVA